MSFENDPLKECNLDVVNTLLAKDWPKSLLVKRWIETRSEWHSKDPQNYPYYVLAPGGDPNDGIVFFGKFRDRVVYQSVYTFNDDITNMTEALRTTERIDWRQRTFFGVPPERVEWFTELMRERGMKLTENDKTDYYWLPEDEARSIRTELSPNVYLGMLNERDVSTMNAQWPHGFADSEQYLNQLSVLNYGLGLFSKCDDELLCWAVKYEYGDIGALHTKVGHRNKGHATQLVKAMITLMRCNHETPIVYILSTNTASVVMFTKMKFQLAGSCNWLVFDTPNSS